MAMEKSVFHGEAMIRDFITAHYDLHPTAIEKLDLGSANCFKISCDGGEFFLKEFQSKLDWKCYLQPRNLPIKLRQLLLEVE